MPEVPDNHGEDCEAMGLVEKAFIDRRPYLDLFNTYLRELAGTRIEDIKLSKKCIERVMRFVRFAQLTLLNGVEGAKKEEVSLRTFLATRSKKASYQLRPKGKGSSDKKARYTGAVIPPLTAVTSKESPQNNLNNM